jgi:LysM repeat protein
MVIESLIVVVVVGLAVTGMLWLRRSWTASVAPEQVAVDNLVTARPTDVPTYTPPATAAPTEPPGTAVPPAPTTAPETAVHVIVSGDSLYGIALQYGVTIDDILAVNEGMTTESFLGIGQELRIPAAQSDEAEPPATQVAQDPGPATPVPGASDGATQTASAASVPADGPTDTAAAAGTGADQATGVTETAGITQTTGTAPAGVGAAGTAADRLLGQEANLDGGAAESFGPPLLLAPGHGQMVAEDMPLLRWASAGILPPGAYYVVLLRDAPEGAAEADPAPAEAVDTETTTLEWVLTNATALRVPSAFRPSFGSSSAIQWTVGVRRRTNGLLTDETGIPLGPNAHWRSFTWSPGAE